MYGEGEKYVYGNNNNKKELLKEMQESMDYSKDFIGGSNRQAYAQIIRKQKLGAENDRDTILSTTP